MQIPDTDTPLILLALGVAMYHVPDPERVEMEELERRVQALRGTDFEQINKDNTMSNDTLIELIEAASAVVSNHEHAFSGGMCSYQKGSDTWQLFESLRTANDAAAAAFRAGKFAAGRVAASPPVPDIANSLKFVIDWLEGGKDPLLAAKELRSLVAASPAPVSPPERKLHEASRDAAVETLMAMGYSYLGAELWKPPIGKRPAWLAEPAPPAEMADKNAKDLSMVLVHMLDVINDAAAVHSGTYQPGIIDSVASLFAERIGAREPTKDEKIAALLFTAKGHAERAQDLFYELGQPVAQKADAEPVVEVAKATPFKHRSPGSFVQAAGILQSDTPVAVIRKLNAEFQYFVASVTEPVAHKHDAMPVEIPGTEFELLKVLSGSDYYPRLAVLVTLLSKPPYATPQAPALTDCPLKDGEIAATVNALRDVAVEYHSSQQLRARIAKIVIPFVNRALSLADSKRLDFLVTNSAYVVCDEQCDDGFWLHYVREDGTTWVQVASYKTPREAIDAAMAAKDAA